MYALVELTIVTLGFVIELLDDLLAVEMLVCNPILVSTRTIEDCVG